MSVDVEAILRQRPYHVQVPDTDALNILNRAGLDATQQTHALQSYRRQPVNQTPSLAQLVSEYTSVARGEPGEYLLDYPFTPDAQITAAAPGLVGLCIGATAAALEHPGFAMNMAAALAAWSMLRYQRQSRIHREQREVVQQALDAARVQAQLADYSTYVLPGEYAVYEHMNRLCVGQVNDGYVTMELGSTTRAGRSTHNHIPLKDAQIVAALAPMQSLRDEQYASLERATPLLIHQTDADGRTRNSIGFLAHVHDSELVLYSKYGVLPFTVARERIKSSYELARHPTRV